MSTYKALVGKKIKSVSSDPSDSVDGQMWYNTTTQSLRGLAITEAWSSSGPLLEANYGAGGAGSQTAMIYFGGSPYPARTNKTVEYNGTGWNTGGDYTGTVNYLSGCGTLTAGLGAGGFTGTANTTASAEYNGTSWTAGNSMSQQRMNTGSTMVGTQPAALITGGDQYPSTPRSLSTCEEYDGTNWTSGGAYPVVIQNTAQAGTQTAGWAAGGLSDPAPGVSNISRDATNHYDGSSWSAGGTLPTATFRAGASGTQTAGLFFAGKAGPYPSPPGNVTTTFAYDGSTWTAKPSLATARQSIAAGGVSSPSTAAIGAGGYTSPGVTAATEEFTASTNVITGAAWTSGPNLGTARNSLSGCGTQTAGLVAGGDNNDPSYSTEVEEYNGTSWSEQNDLPANRRSGAMAGTQTASIYFGGQSYPNVQQEESFKYDGSSWTSGGNLPVTNAFGGVAGTGTQTAALGVGGYSGNPGSYINTVFEYNGSSWSTNPNNYPGAITEIGHCGTQTAALLIGGGDSGGSYQTTSFTYDGSSFSAAPNLIYAHSAAASGGTQTDAIACTGRTTPQPSASNQAQGYDGTSWASRPSLGSARRVGASGKNTSPAAASWAAGGYTGSDHSNAYEEFTGETTAANVETFSTS